MFNPLHFENAQPGGVAVMEVVGKEDELPAFVPLRRTTLHGTITGPLADLVVIHQFGYNHTESERTLEARYRFPLPGDAAVMGVTVRFGEVEIVADLKERRVAEDDYAQARREGRQAALATREGADAFTLQVAGLQPDQEITVETHYVQLARTQGDGWMVRVPLTLAPRYVRGDEQAARHAQGQPLALLRDPGHRFALDLEIRGAQEVTSPTHSLSTLSNGNHQQLHLAEGEVLPDRDFVLNWQPAAAAHHPLFTLFTYPRPEGTRQTGWHYFAAQVAPPAMKSKGKGPAREVILLVDHSGSMTGPKWAASDWAVERFLSNLGADDEFALAFFHNTTHWFNTRLQPATAENSRRAVSWLKEHRESGGTELGVALEQALQLKRTRGERARHLLVVTDAEVTDAARILRLADSEAEQSERRRISVLCIDAAPNAYLAQELADRGGGVARFLTSDPDQEDIATALDEVLSDWSEPVIVGLALTVNRAKVEASGHRVTASGPTETSIDLGDLVAGRPLWAVGRVRGDETKSLAFAIQSGQGRLLDEIVVDRSEAGTEAIKALFGARRINALEHLSAAGYDDAQLRAQLARLGYDAEEVLGSPTNGGTKVYAENQREETRRQLSSLLRDEALAYHLASAETAFVAIRREAGKVVEGSVDVGNALPTGWSAEFLTNGGVSAGRAMLQSAAPMMPTPALSVMPTLFAAPPSGATRAIGRVLDSVAKKVTGAAAREDEPSATLFSGAIQWQGPVAVLFDSNRQDDPFTTPVMITALLLQAGDLTADGAGQARLLIFVEDLASPRAQMALRDLLQFGERPLNVRRRPGQHLMITLRDDAGSLAQKPVSLQMQVRWRPAVGM